MLHATLLQACFLALESITEPHATITIKYIESGISIDANSTQSYSK